MKSFLSGAAVGLALLLMGSGCATHSVMRMSNSVSVSGKSATAYPAHSNKVFMTEATLPASVKYEKLGQIDVGIVTYANEDAVLSRMADAARGLGADAVVDLHIWFQPAGWAWRAPQGKGQAVKLQDKAAFDALKLKGTLH